MGGFTASVPQFVDVPDSPERAEHDAGNKDQKRSTMACVHCRRRKMRCVKQDESACVACARLGKSCKFVPISEAENLKARQKKRDSRLRKAHMPSQASTVSSITSAHPPLQWPQPETSLGFPKSARFSGTRRASLDREQDAERHPTRKRGATVSGAGLTHRHQRAVPLPDDDDINGEGQSTGLEDDLMSDDGMKTERSLYPDSLSQLPQAGNLGGDLPSWAQPTFASSDYFAPWHPRLGSSSAGLDATAGASYQSMPAQTVDATGTRQQESVDGALNGYAQQNINAQSQQDPGAALNVSPALSHVSMAGIELRPSSSAEASQAVNGTWGAGSMSSSIDALPSGLPVAAPTLGMQTNLASTSGCDDAISPVLLGSSDPTTTTAAMFSTPQVFPSSTTSPPSTSSSATWGSQSLDSQASSDASSLATEATGWLNGTSAQTTAPSSRPGTSYLNSAMSTEAFKPTTSMPSMASTAPSMEHQGNVTPFTAPNLWRMPSDNIGSASQLSTEFGEDMLSMADSNRYSQFCHQSPTQLEPGLQQLLTRGY